MHAQVFLELLEKQGIDFYTGVPDSLLNGLCMELLKLPATRHLVAVNEGSAIALAAGHTIGTGAVSAVYCQNSGLGNLMNPVCSLTHPEVYGIPMLLVVGWRGEPGTVDEPQHRYQGQITLETLALLGVQTVVLCEETTPSQLERQLTELMAWIRTGQTGAVVVKKGGLNGAEPKREALVGFSRERAIEEIISRLKESAVVSSTGKMSRELYELREQRKEGHKQDFLTVGSMGHCSALALSLALAQPRRRVLCLDGDGALLMHMGALATIGSAGPKNLIHVVLDNGAHETVGGVPTASGQIDFCSIARACGYEDAWEADDLDSLRQALCQILAGADALRMLRVRVANQSRENLGRPNSTPQQNLTHFKQFVRGGK